MHSKDDVALEEKHREDVRLGRFVWEFSGPRVKALKLGTPIGGWHKVFWKGGGKNWVYKICF